MGCTCERKRLAGTDCVGCTCDRKQFRCIIVFLALLYVFPYLSARRSHTTSFCRACVPGGHIPNGFWVVWEGPPYRPHSLGEGSKCRCGKGLKTVCLGPTRTSVFTFMQRVKVFLLFLSIYSFGKHHVVRKDLGTYVQLNIDSMSYYC